MKKTKINNFFQELYLTIDKKAKQKSNESYTNFLLKSGSKKISKKILEESGELVIDYVKGSKKRIIEETADLIYHLLVMLYSKKISLRDIEKELKKRRK